VGLDLDDRNAASRYDDDEVGLALYLPDVLGEILRVQDNPPVGGRVSGESLEHGSLARSGVPAD